MAKARFELYKDKSGEWRFRLVAPNNETIAVSEGYSSKQAAIKGIEAVKKYAATAEIVEKEE
ncbi:MAG: DUF1508 domain-containing protein [Thermoprotei archaeon]|nr:MAG: DUF1508 domain-containing protein [Thermoprotei archaeon]